MAVSDFQINARVRSVLARHWIDTQRMRIGSFRGTVRLSGELRLICERRTGRKFDGMQLELVVNEIRAICGVSRVHFDLSNWMKSESGKMTPIEQSSRHSSQNVGREVIMTSACVSSSAAKR
jgi:hypothetical protein